MVNVYSADQNERMERLDQISSLVGNYLLRGYKMLADECGTCRTVILEVSYILYRYSIWGWAGGKSIKV